MCDERLWLHQIAAFSVPVQVADTSRADNLVVIDDSGHLSSIEHPDVVTEELLRLFAQ